jgi:hypothetical protein
MQFGELPFLGNIGVFVFASILVWRAGRHVVRRRMPWKRVPARARR